MGRTAEEIREAIEEAGEPPSYAEALALCDRAIEADRLDGKIEALTKALLSVGMKIIDTTTDDDEGTVLQIVQIDAEDD